MSEDADSRILKGPIIRSGVDHASRVAVCIDLYCRKTDGSDDKVGSGTGFFHRHKNGDFLITNWHVLTGRNPQQPDTLLDGYPASPSSFSVHLPHKDNPNHYKPSALFPLYENGEAVWLEEKPFVGRGRNDLAAIKFMWPDTTNGPLVTPISEFSPGPRDFLRVGMGVVIVGYPFGIAAENPYPVWKRGYIASEPSILIGGLPKFYIDSPGRPGMSGSPVFMISSGMGLPKAIAERLNNPVDEEGAIQALMGIDSEKLLNAPEVNVMRFVGVYSGSVGEKSLETLRVGVAWHAAMVDRIFSDPMQGTNPFPPFIAHS